MQETPSTSQVIRFSTFELDVRAGELRKQGVRIKLQEQPFRILEMFLAHPGELVTRDELRTRLWPSESFVDFDHGLNKAINKLREALGDSAESPRFIETLARRGYRFLADLASDRRQIRSLLVLPLENLAHDPEQDFLADGLTEALITNLARISALRVISRTTAAYYKQVNKPLPEIARELSVEGVVEGTVLRAGDRIRISAQLIHASSDTHLWADTYDRDLRDVMALQSEVAQTIARQVEARVMPHEQALLTTTRQVDPRVYEDYLKGRFFWNKRTEDGMRRGAEFFQRAIERDPQYAPAYAGLADTLTRLGWWGYVKPEDGCGRAKVAASKALEIDDTLGDAHGALAFSLLHYDYSFRACEEECRRAIELDTSSSIAAQVYACCLIAWGRFEEGIFQALRATQLDPLSLALQWSAGVFIYQARQYDRAIAQTRRCLELDPNFPAAWSTIAFTYAKTRTGESGIPQLEQAIRVTGGNQFFLGTLGYSYAMDGRRADAVKVLEQLNESGKQRHVSAFWPAIIHGALGETDDAFRFLDAAYQEHAPWVAYAKVLPVLDTVRSDARMDAFLQKVNFPPV